MGTKNGLTVLDVNRHSNAGGKVQIAMRPTADDERIFAALEKRLGVNYSQVIRLAIRALCAKEGIELA